MNPEQARTPLYLAAALVGSSYIWWSAFQGIREKDFTADIPVSFATAGALIIGQYAAAAVVAVLMLVGGMMEEFVSARAGKTPPRPSDCPTGWARPRGFARGGTQW